MRIGKKRGWGICFELWVILLNFISAAKVGEINIRLRPPGCGNSISPPPPMLPRYGQTCRVLCETDSLNCEYLILPQAAVQKNVNYCFRSWLYMNSFIKYSLFEYLNFVQIHIQWVVCGDNGLWILALELSILNWCLQFLELCFGNQIPR